jgi:anti-anti-sigma factor
VNLEEEKLNAKEAPIFKQEILDLIQKTNTYKIILDIQKIKFIDSSGLGSLLSILRLVKDQGGDIKIANMKKPIRALFELVSMHKIFEIYNSVEEAEQGFERSH